MFGSLGDAFKLPDLKRRLLFTLGILFIFRLGAHIPTPGVDTAAMANLFNSVGGGVMDFLNLFSGGALSQFSIFSLGVAPYINSSIVMQLLVVIFPALEKMQKDSADGRKKLIQWTRYGSIVFAVVQAVGMTAWIGNQGIFSGTLGDAFMIVTTLTAGSLAVMWLGEELSDHGIGNGISLLIFAGIVARIPEAFIRVGTMLRLGEMNFLALLAGLALMIVVVAGCILLQEGQRRLPVQYAKRVVGNKVYGGQSTFIPLKINQAGVIPIIFASSILIFPYTIANFFSDSAVGAFIRDLFAAGRIFSFYTLCYVVLVVFFSYFYTAVVFNPTDIASNMKKYGGFILGIRRSADVGLHQPRDGAHHHGGGHLPGDRRHHPQRDDLHRGDPKLLLRRDGGPDRRGRRPGHDQPDRGPAPDAPLRRNPEEVRRKGRKPASHVGGGTRCD